MMLEVKRTLVKSGPELWAEVADAAAMERHLGSFGEVRITRAEPERLVEWEAERGRGAVRLEPSGFGTRVVLTADTLPLEEPPRLRWWARMLGRRPEPPTPLIADDAALAALAGTLDALGTAHHRPFSRA